MDKVLGLGLELSLIVDSELDLGWLLLKEEFSSLCGGVAVVCCCALGLVAVKIDGIWVVGVEVTVEGENVDSE